MNGCDQRKWWDQGDNMKFTVQDTHLAEVKIITPDRFEDHRGYFYEVYADYKFRDLGLPDKFVQINCSGSVKGVIRGLHFQWDPPMGKLMRIIRGEAFIVAVDIRRQSPTLGKWVGISATDKNCKQLWAPACFARGFCALSDYVEIEYLCTGTYNGAAEAGILWNDPEIGINWPIKDPILSDRDKIAPTLQEWLQSEKGNVWDNF